MSDLSSLIARLEKAEGPNYAIEVGIFKFFNPEYSDYVQGRGGLVHRSDGEDQRVLSNVRPPNVTASIDAAVSLAERVLPGFGISIDTHPVYGDWWDASIFDQMPKTISNARKQTGPLALVLATLRALDQKGSSNG